MLVYNTILLGSILYVLIKKRRFDAFSVLVMSCFLFTVPLMIGIVTGPRDYVAREISPDVYLSFSIFLALVCGSMFFYDLVFGRVSKRYSVSRLLTDNSYIVVVGFIFIFLYVYLIAQNGFGIFFGSSKRDLMDSNGMILTLSNMIAVVLAYLLYVRYTRRSLFFAFLVLLITLLAGHRSPTVFFFLLVSIDFFERRGIVRLINSIGFKAYVVFLFVGIFVVLAKPILAVFKYGSFDSLESRIDSDPFAVFFAGMEFMRTQYIFNEIVLENFSTDGMHIWRGFASLIPVPRSLYTTPSNEFNGLFQPVLFPDIPGGLANNNLAEVYAAYDIAGIFVFSIFFAILVFVVNHLYLHAGGFLKVVLGFLIIYICFYSFRNSVGVTFGFIRNLGIIFFMVMFFRSLLAAKIVVVKDRYD